jgi:B9 domain-containing protein 2
MNAARRAMRIAAKPAPEVHVVGEICGASGFGSGVPVSCKWVIEAGEKWDLLEGAKAGQTQTDEPDSGSDTVVWSHPLDVHYVAGAVGGWPRLVLQVWALDAYGRLDVAGYGFVHLPSTAGVHELSCPTWRPVGTNAQEFASFFVGGRPALTSTAPVFSAAADRFRLVTASAGTVYVRVEVVHRNLDLYGVDT